MLADVVQWALLLGCGHAFARIVTASGFESVGGGANLAEVPLRAEIDPGRKLTGRFLHISDVHPDPFYKVHSDEDEACHRGKGPAGVYGAETTDCDSPYSLVNATFQWIKDNLKDEVDFVVWTGDSARHDNDEHIPRTHNQIVSQNEFLVQKFLEVWGKPDNYDDPDPTNDFMIPIVPTLGNNDILPHNIFLQGPNTWTRTYLDIWRQFVPEEQRHQFQRGGWFFVEVIPNKLAVISLNTLYFYTKNAAVDGCAPKSEWGTEQMDWLRIQLRLLRERGMKAMIIGHVPPARTESKLSWDETCWQKYTLWMESYRDVVAGSFYGHMNIDHFIVQDFEDIKKSTRKGAIREMDAEEKVLRVESERSYLMELRDMWSDIIVANGVDADKKGKKGKKNLDHIGGEHAERFAVSHVSPSVIPNYFPTVRVYEYNLTGLQDTIFPYPGGPIGTDRDSTYSPQSAALSESLDESLEEYLFAVEKAQEVVSTHGSKANKKKKKKKKKPKKHKFRLPSPPSKSTPPGPAYSPQTFSLLGYTQYYANLTFINNDESLELSKKKPSPKPKEFGFEVEYNTTKDKVYKIDDLLVRSYVELAERIGKKKKGDSFLAATDVDDADDVLVDEDVEAEKKGKKHKKKHKKKKGKKMNKVWFEFVKRAFVGSLDPEEIEEYFGEVVDGIDGADAESRSFLGGQLEL